MSSPSGSVIAKLVPWTQMLSGRPVMVARNGPQDQFCLLNPAPSPSNMILCQIYVSSYHFWQRQVLAKSGLLAILCPIQTLIQNLDLHCLPEL